MKNEITVFCTNNGEYRNFPTGSNLLDVLDKLSLEPEHQFVCARVNNKHEPLTYELYRNKTVTFLDNTVPNGMRAYVRSLFLILAKAVNEVLPNEQMNIEHPISLGYFCKIHRLDKVEQTTVDAIKAKMKEYIAADMPIEWIEKETSEIIEMFRERGRDDVAILLETGGAVYSKYYQLGDYVDYFYGCMVPSTGYIDLFDLIPYENGLFLRIPNRKKPKDLEPVIEQPKMYQVYKDHLKFLNIIGIDNVGDLNEANRIGQMSSVIKVSEALQEKNIASIGEQIARRFDDGVRIVLVSGPSSSGKTTFRMRLEVQLMTNLIKPVGLSLDNYFVDRDKTPRDENGEYDFESLYALDLDLFNSDLERLLKGEKVALPTFNFATGTREYRGNELQIDENCILVIEGIHGLNPELTAHIPDSKKFMIYVSALTTISIDNHNYIPTTDNRLLRRLVRDFRYRGYSAIDTLSRWNSVRAGEDKWIFPYQENADIMFNSAMMYELAALRRYAEPVLLQVPVSALEYSEAHRLLKFLSYFSYINDKELPPTSLLREFLGGSSFKY
jgi:uridine kinase